MSAHKYPTSDPHYRRFGQYACTLHQAEAAGFTNLSYRCEGYITKCSFTATLVSNAYEKQQSSTNGWVTLQQIILTTDRREN